MPTVYTYALVSRPETPSAVQSHPAIQDSEFERQRSSEEDDSLPSLQFAAREALEERTDLEEACRELSASFPEATVVCCTVVERFQQTERLTTAIFEGGTRTGDFEHGHVYNVRGG